MNSDQLPVSEPITPDDINVHPDERSFDAVELSAELEPLTPTPTPDSDRADSNEAIASPTQTVESATVTVVEFESDSEAVVLTEITTEITPEISEVATAVTPEPAPEETNEDTTSFEALFETADETLDEALDLPEPTALESIEDLTEESTEPEVPPAANLEAVNEAEAIAPQPEPEPEPVAQPPEPSPINDLTVRIEALQLQEQALKQQVQSLQTTVQKLQSQIIDTQGSLGQVVQEGLRELEQRRQTLQLTVEQLERRQERIRKEMRTTFAGASQDLAIRVQGFKDYLVGSLQDLVSAAEGLNLIPEAPEPVAAATPEPETKGRRPNPRFAEQTFQEEVEEIRGILDRYRTAPDYYGQPWQLRRTFEPIHAERVSNWFFNQGGRGALRSMGSRLQNILVASATISVLRELYEEDLRTLILANSPERLGEWRRGLQDCLGIARGDFGPNSGVTLFETPDALIQKADRIMKDDGLPLVIIDESEESINLGLLQFPLWLAFAYDPQQPRLY